MLSQLALLSILTSLSGVQADPFWVVRHGHMVQSRMDAIISPGQVSGHTHAIIGTSSFDPTYTYENSQKGDCVTANVEVDKSSYWVPQLYAQWPNGSFTLQEFRGANTYYQVRRQENEPVVEFPPGFRMMAGDPFRTTYDENDLSNAAVSYACLYNGKPETKKFPDNEFCDGGLRAQVYFPHCWDGKNNWLEGNAHVSYGAEGTFDGGGKCPDSHPKRIIGLFFEFFFTDVDPKSGAKRVWAQGDDTGYGFHGDFTNGWPEGLFKKIFDQGETCNVGFSLENCPPLKEVMKDTDNCEYSGLIVNENIGYNGSLDKLPGNNPVFGSSGPRKSDPNYIEKAQFVRAVNGVPGGGEAIPPPAAPSPTQINAGVQHIDTIGGDTGYTGPTFIAGDGATGGGGGRGGAVGTPAPTSLATTDTDDTAPTGTITDSIPVDMTPSATSGTPPPSGGGGNVLIGLPTASDSTTTDESNATSTVAQTTETKHSCGKKRSRARRAIGL